MLDLVKQDDEHLLVIDEDPLINDVWTWESDLGSLIVAMQRAGVAREQIAEVLKQKKKVNRLSSQEATRIYREFMEMKK
ncbi:hypothetical protein [Paenibacillus sp. Root444D2]|uniref:hypothetical protein n=1 Tax=Paenibacillus sp. Root444D2 TaxID=1736538 RepID=UPI00070ED706|nr:hypothetical protein [Paenibacillus sp. Root444D2]KQX45863.1 hypothetical protein ASD40_18680 [Paenibacillus sp. Root444D2]